MNVATIETPRVNVKDLEDTDVDALVDLHVFDNDAWCDGRVAFRYDPSASMWQCTQCGATEDHAKSALVMDRHVRLVPRYTGDMGLTWRIVENIKARSAQTRARFLFYLRVLTESNVTAIFDAKPRDYSVAALQTLKIVDKDGFIINKGAE